MKNAAAKFTPSCPQLVVKGCAKHAPQTPSKSSTTAENYFTLAAPKIATPYTHGAGCTFSAAIGAGLAQGLPVRDAVARAKKFITAAIGQGFPLNAYVGPTWHGAHRAAGG
jgi:pyridoxine kinase